jgi:ABC-2 type transport system permease protein
MKFRQIFRFEFIYQLRHVATWLIAGFFFLFGFTLPRIGTPAGEVYLNSNSFIAFITVFAGILWLLMGGLVAGDAATRDVQTRMYPMVYTTPTGKAKYLGGRFFAAFILNGLIQLTVVAGMVLSFYGPGAQTELIGPFQPAAYLTAFGFIALPNVFIITAIQFAIAQRRGTATASYIISVFLLITSQFLSTSLGKKLHWGEFEKMFDLTGIINVMVDLETWTPHESNTRLIQLKGMLLASRLLWTTIGVAALVYTYYRFHFSHVGERPNRRNLFKRRQGSPSETSLARSGISTSSGPTIIPQVCRKFDFLTHARQALAIAWTSFRVIAKSRGGFVSIAILSLGAALLSGLWMQFFSVPLLPRMQEVLRFFTPPLNDLKTLWVIIPFLIVVYAGELVWREREAHVNELSDTTPVRESVFFMGQFLGLSFVIIMWMTILMVGGILIQIILKYNPESFLFEFGVLVKALFGIQLVNYVLFALLVLAVQVVVNQKYLGYIVSLMILLFIGFSSKMGVEHKLLVYASDTGWSYSDMRGFDPFIMPWLWFKFYWSSWALLIAVLAILFWIRGKENGLKARFQLAKHRFACNKWAAVTSLMLIATTGGFIFFNTNMLNEYSTASERMERRAEYEKRYGKFEHVAQPLVTGTKLHVDIYPGERKMKIHGTYRLVNKSEVAIDSIHLATISTVDTKAVSFDRAATQELADDELGHRIYKLKKPLQPGEAVQLTFEVYVEPNGFAHNGIDPSIVENGTYFRSQDVLPAIGYQDLRRIRAEHDRKKYGLAPRPEIPSLYDVEARQYRRHAEPTDFEAIVSTDEDQIAVAPGTLQRAWTEGERKYFRYVTNAPIHNQYAFFSANYGVREAEWIDSSSREKQSVRIQIFHHPGHVENLDRMIRSIEASLQYYTTQFGPYPYDLFRVIEHPGHGRGMHAEATTIDFMEGYSLMSPGDLDLPFHIMAHEVAHQWWGMQLTPAFVEGLGVLVESFATFSAMQVVEETLGHEHLRAYLRQVREEYETPRSRFAPPLLQSNNSFMNYRKGPFALYAMSKYIGMERVNDVMRSLLKEYGSGKPPLPTTLDLYGKLQAVTPDSLQYLVHDLFATNTLWDLTTERALAKQTSDGNWQVTLALEARKVTVDSTGAETSVPMNDWIEIGVYAPLVKGRPARAIYLEKHRISTGKQTITMLVTEKPARAGIDPNYLMIDPNMYDNTEAVKIEQ